MKFNKIVLSIVTAGLLAFPSAVSADDEESDFSWLDRDTWDLQTSGEIIGKIGTYTGSGKSHNPKLNADGSANPDDLSKAEITAKLFLNYEMSDETSFHAGLQFNLDDSQIDGYRSTRQDSQFDWLREVYIDTMTGDNLSWRLGKQQVVWGKADGVKFLDIINPTDFRHWGQDSMEDSRIPLWMINAEYAINDNSSVQVVYVPQVDVTNQIPGLYNTTTGDQGQPFVPLGTDALFGQYNGFLNIGPELGNVATVFVNTFGALLPNYGAAFGNNILLGFDGMTVSGFTNLDGTGTFPNGAQNTVDNFLIATNPTGATNTGSGYQAGSVNGASLTPVTGNQVLNGATYNTGALGTATYGAAATTNLFGGTLNTPNPTTMFDYMGDTTFATFDTFQGMNTRYAKKHAGNDFKNGNIGFKYAGTNDDIGLNYTFNYYYHYDNNPVLDISWEGANGQALVARAITNDINASGNAITAANGNIGNAVAYQTQTMKLFDAQTGTVNYNPAVAGSATMVFTEKQNRINTFGTSFDYALDTALAPVIIRSEIVYDKDTLVPVVDLSKLAIGDLAGAFTNQKADFLNYVVGVDVTVMTNLFVSFQFMDKWNLNYVNEQVKSATTNNVYSKHTANPATMSLSNGFKAGEEHAMAYTLFFSKPFLEGEPLRVNNIFLLENQAGGWWDRLDFEYTYTDDIILTGAMNQYGGDSNGVFGQFENMSNVELGFKYIF